MLQLIRIFVIVSFYLSLLNLSKNINQYNCHSFSFISPLPSLNLLVASNIFYLLYRYSVVSIFYLFLSFFFSWEDDCSLSLSWRLIAGNKTLPFLLESDLLDTAFFWRLFFKERLAFERDNFRFFILIFSSFFSFLSR